MAALSSSSTRCSNQRACLIDGYSQTTMGNSPMARPQTCKLKKGTATAICSHTSTGEFAHTSTHLLWWHDQLLPCRCPDCRLLLDGLALQLCQPSCCCCGLSALQGSRQQKQARRQQPCRHASSHSEKATRSECQGRVTRTLHMLPCTSLHRPVCNSWSAAGLSHGNPCACLHMACGALAPLFVTETLPTLSLVTASHMQLHVQDFYSCNLCLAVPLALTQPRG